MQTPNFDSLFGLAGDVNALSVYVHVPYCSRRCGYCDFNTYTNLSLGSGVGGYADALIGEFRMTREHLGVLPPLRSVFFGGGTPTVLPARDLVKILRAIHEIFGVSSEAEITTEANPDSVDQTYLKQLRDGGFTRVSFGMQSAVQEILLTLDRTHTKTNLEAGVKAAQSLGLETSVDLIYGTPGESLEDWNISLQTALELGVKHVSCYALVIEEGTAMSRLLHNGQIPPVDADDQADKYELADEVLSAAGLPWYEISNWAAPGHECRHNLAYWMNQDWLGFGPGSHSHLHSAHGSHIRYWEVKHPVRWVQLLREGCFPFEDAEIVKGESAWLETVLLNIRLRAGLDLAAFAGQVPEGFLQSDSLMRVGAQLVAEGLLDRRAFDGGRAVLTLRGRLLADTVIQRFSGE